MTSKMKMSLKNEENIKNEDDIKNEDIIKNEDDLKSIGSHFQKNLLKKLPEFFFFDFSL